jgi:hypothetical protein
LERLDDLMEVMLSTLGITNTEKSIINDDVDDEWG